MPCLGLSLPVFFEGSLFLGHRPDLRPGRPACLWDAGASGDGPMSFGQRPFGGGRRYGWYLASYQVPNSSGKPCPPGPQKNVMGNR